jgi:hypothetical protein
MALGCYYRCEDRWSPCRTRPYQYVNHQLGVSHITAGVAPVGVNWGQSTQSRLHATWLQHARIQGLQCRWDGNRTGALRFWSLLPSVQQGSGTYLDRLEMGHLVDPKYVDVHQRSPALGSTLGSKQPDILVSTGCHLGVRMSRSEVESRLTNPELASLPHFGRSFSGQA